MCLLPKDTSYLSTTLLYLSQITIVSHVQIYSLAMNLWFFLYEMPLGGTGARLPKESTNVAMRQAQSPLWYRNTIEHRADKKDRVFLTWSSLLTNNCNNAWNKIRPIVWVLNNACSCVTGSFHFSPFLVVLLILPFLFLQKALLHSQVHVFSLAPALDSS
jgi:hypothetical protein